VVICKARYTISSHFACRLVWALLLVLGLMVPAQAAGAPEADPTPQLKAALERLESQVAAAGMATERELKTLQKEIDTVRSSARDCVQEAEQAVEKLDKELAILRPEKPADEKESQEGQASEQPETPVSPAIARQLEDLQSRKAGLEGRIATCKLMVLRSNELDSQVKNNLRSLQARQLLVRGPSLLDVVQANLSAPERWVDFTAQLAVKATGWDAIHPAHLAGATAVGLLGIIVGLVLARRLRPRAARMRVEEEEVSAGLWQALIACGVSYAPILLALGGISTYLTLIPITDEDLPLVVNLIYGLLIFFIMAAAIRTLLTPCPPASHYLPLPEEVATPLAWRSRVLVLIVLIWWLALELRSEGLLDETMFTLTQQIIGLVWVLNVIWLIWLLRRLERWRDKWTVSLLLSLGLVGGLVASWIGYIDLGDLVIRGITRTLFLVGLVLLLSRFFSDLFDGLDEGRYSWQRTVRRVIGLKGDEYVPGMGWLRLFVNLALWTGIALLVLRVWGAGEITADIVRYFREGFQVAGLTVVPSQLLWAILALALLLTLTRWFKGRLNSRWLTQTRMEQSAREALVTTFGYVAVAVSLIVALSIAGIEFTNLAIIAGALSVGIGFGLQNVVNNFVSGIIMLVERPVRTGDWIVVGETEGYVKRISIRTTSIQTFDRAEVIVPNSELISGQVTNWTLRNLWGRIKVPIGVAYGSDTAMVRETLLEIANQHADVIKSNPQLPDPFVLFLGFGDSSLNFELRAVVQNIDRRLSVISDINFAIDAAFREKGIEIPFPQRDLNFRGPLQVEHNPSGGGDSKL
jgi:small-conductance mechanosensitive channel